MPPLRTRARMRIANAVIFFRPLWRRSNRGPTYHLSIDGYLFARTLCGRAYQRHIRRLIATYAVELPAEYANHFAHECRTCGRIETARWES